jgi:methyl-accepting chemotaxis protein
MIKNNSKTTFTLILSIIGVVALILALTIYNITANGKKEIEQFRAEELQRIKNALKDAVDMAYATLETNHKKSRDKFYLERYYGPRLENIIEVAETILNSKTHAVENGELTLSEAQAQAAAEIKKIRYNDGDGYVWITDTALPYPKMIMHPTDPSLDGKVLNDPKYNCALGKDKNRYSAAVEICYAHGKGFVDYLWPKKTQDGVIPDVTKLAYVRLFPDWKWLLGTADYVDDAVTEAIEKSKDDIRQMRYNNGNGYFWISSATQPYIKMIVHPSKPTLEEQILEGKLKKLFESFVEVCEKKNGSGFHEYTWSKKSTVGFSMTEDVEKISYMRLYEPLGWIVGTDVSLDSLDKAVAEKQKNVEKQTTILMLIGGIPLFIVFLMIGVLIYMRNSYILNSNVNSQTAHVAKPISQSAPVEKPQMNPAANAKLQPASMVGNRAMTEEIPVLTPTPEPGMLRTEDCVKMVQEISKTLITEHAKILAMAIQRAPQSDFGVYKPLEVSHEINKLTNKTHQTIEEVRKRIGGSQEQSQAGGSAENAKFKVVSDLNKMVGNMTQESKL